MAKNTTGPADVDAYIERAPKNVRAKLEEVRRTIKQVAPSAKESISYKMPFYDYKGRLAWFALQSDYIGLYLRPPVIQDHKKYLTGYVTTLSAVHFLLSQDTRIPLIKRLVKARMKINEGE